VQKGWTVASTNFLLMDELLAALGLAGLCGGLTGSFAVFVVALIALLSACTLAGGCRC
jgi:hypothetical protein